MVDDHPGQWSSTWPMAAEDADKLLDWIKVDKKGREDFAAFREAVGTFDVSKTERGLSATFGDGKSRLMTIRHDDKDEKPKHGGGTARIRPDAPDAHRPVQDTKAVIEKFRSNP